jgi:hypothetical protein
MFDKYGSMGKDWLRAPVVRYAYEHTAEDSKLRRFFKIFILSHGSLCKLSIREADSESYLED